MNQQHRTNTRAAPDSFMAELARIGEQATQIAQDGKQLGMQIPLPQNLELQELTRAFNAMSAAQHQRHLELERRVRERTHSLEETIEKLQQEIAERRHEEEQLRIALQERAILLQEIHHRVKNNLQVISSLLDMQSLSTQDPEVERILQDSRNRVKAVALVHEALYQSADLASINLRDYVKSLTGHLLHVYGNKAPGVTLRYRVDPVPLSLDIAMPCALLLNELVSNALIHAFPVQGEEEGRIWVEFHSQPQDRFTLLVGDNGIGLPPDFSLEDTSSLGLQLVAMLTQQLDGTFKIDRGKGTTLTISFGSEQATAWEDST